MVGMCIWIGQSVPEEKVFVKAVLRSLPRLGDVRSNSSESMGGIAWQVCAFCDSGKLAIAMRESARYRNEPLEKDITVVRKIWPIGLAFVLLGSVTGAEENRPGAPAKVIRVGVFQDAGVSEKVSVLLDLLTARPDLAVTTLNGSDVRGGKLHDCDVMIFPGGSGSKEAASLEALGRDEVRAFVRKGGGYLGICAGAYLASADYEWSLHILDAKVLDRAHWARGHGDVEVRLTDSGRKFFASEAERRTVLYWQGPLLAPAGKPEIPDYETLGTFASEIAENGAPKGVMQGTTAIAQGRYGAGRVFCFSPHPERTADVQEFVFKAVLWAAGK